MFFMIKYSIGNYLERDVVFSYIDKFSNYETSKISNSVVLLYIDSFDWTELKLLNIFEKITSAGALSIWVAGKNAEVNFDLLLNFLSKRKTKYHVMTEISDSPTIAQCLEDFLCIAIPDSAKFDGWETYTLVLLTNEISQNFIETTISNLRIT